MIERLECNTIGVRLIFYHTDSETAIKFHNLMVVCHKSIFTTLGGVVMSGTTNIIGSFNGLSVMCYDEVFITNFVNSNV